MSRNSYPFIFNNSSNNNTHVIHCWGYGKGGLETDKKIYHCDSGPAICDGLNTIPLKNGKLKGCYAIEPVPKSKPEGIKGQAWRLDYIYVLITFNKKPENQ